MIDTQKLSNIIRAYETSAIDDADFVKAMHAEVQRIKNDHKKCTVGTRRHGRRWTAEEELRMMELFRTERDVGIIAAQLDRAQRSVQYRISKVLLSEHRLLTLEGLAQKYRRTVPEIHDAMDTLHNFRLKA